MNGRGGSVGIVPEQKARFSTDVGTDVAMDFSIRVLGALSYGVHAATVYSHIRQHPCTH